MKPRELLTLLLERSHENANSLAVKIGKPQSTIQRFLTGTAKQPRYDTLEKIARYFDIPVMALINERDATEAAQKIELRSLAKEPQVECEVAAAPRIEGGDVAVWNTPDELPPDDTRVWVDRWDYTCSAGDGHIQWEVRQKSALPFTLAFFQAIGSKPENCKLLMVRGDSMEPFLFNRDMMMVDTSKTDIRDGQVYAVCFEGEALVKRVYKQGGGILVLNSYNDRNYPDKTVNPATAAQFEVIGEVVYRSGSGFAAV